MPELPEVETTKRGIAPYLEGQIIRQIITRVPMLRWEIPTDISHFHKQPVTAVKRRGKYLIFETPVGAILVHLGMSGNLRVLMTNTPPGKHDHVDWLLENGHCLRLNDPRRFGAVLTTKDWQQHPLIQHLGPEPLDDAFNADYLYTLAKSRHAPIKNVIMDSKVVVGVGNIYAAESLFRAGIHPKRKANQISKARISALVSEIKAVLDEAIHKGGTTLKDFVGGDGKPGYFQQSLNVYGRGAQPCPRCQTTLKEIKLAGRSTIFCPACQR